MAQIRPHWLLFVIGWTLCFGVAYAGLAQTLWREEAHAHGPLIGGIVVWLLWHQRVLIARVQSPDTRTLWLGMAALAGGLGLRMAGALFATPQLEMAAQLPTLAGVVVLWGGLPALRRAWFPIAFLVFMIPIPGAILHALTAGLKEGLAWLADDLLYAVGLPVARQGNVFVVGAYQLFLADACAGMNSIVALYALGIFYIWYTQRRDWFGIGVLMVGILPIAFFANLFRVIALVVITYYGGDSLARWLHTLIGLTVFALELLLMMALDSALPRTPRKPFRWPDESTVSGRHLAVSISAIAMALTAVASYRLSPNEGAGGAAVTLAAVAPEQMGAWRLVATDRRDMTIVTPEALPSAGRQQEVARIYEDDTGQQIMLLVAYAPSQLDDQLQAHRPEFCYRSQGFSVRDDGISPILPSGTPLQVQRMFTRRLDRHEAVTYWMTVAGQPVLPGWDRKLAKLERALEGAVADGALIRISSLSKDGPTAYALHERFIDAWVQSVSRENRSVLGLL